MPLLRPLGCAGLVLATLVLGGNVCGRTAAEYASFAVLGAFVASGGNAIDTADAYSAWAATGVLAAGLRRRALV